MAENQTSVAAGPADRAPQSPGATSHSDTSVFSDEGDQTIIAAADEQRNHLPALVNAVVPPSPPTESAALRTVKQAQGMTKVEEDPTYAPFRRAVECQKQISDVLFDPTTKVTNPQRAKILGCGYTCDFVYSCHRTRSTRLEATTDTLFEELDNGNLSDVDGEFDDSDDKSVQPCASGEAPMESDSESFDDESGLDISGG
ncbi:hypothetical protein HPB50_015363 [Hyalomma asiaticum]|uniref:Uncharacterized protein n=1 Tax=Hyalomma asiaticum TaxID=266040 RepID=A0ACB7RUH8_HYAAI|nr:hypothetical protein HPB50_015363 [Hyalomma asiaticum]